MLLANRSHQPVTSPCFIQIYWGLGGLAGLLIIDYWADNAEKINRLVGCECFSESEFVNHKLWCSSIQIKIDLQKFLWFQSLKSIEIPSGRLIRRYSMAILPVHRTVCQRHYSSSRFKRMVLRCCLDAIGKGSIEQRSSYLSKFPIMAYNLQISPRTVQLFPAGRPVDSTTWIPVGRIHMELQNS